MRHWGQPLLKQHATRNGACQDRRDRRRIDHADYADELQRARHRVADRNVFGAHLNTVAPN